MAVTLTAFNAAASMVAATIKARMQSVEDWINRGHVSGDLATDSKFTVDHIYAPDFYGAPAPRAELTCGDLHLRGVGWDWTRASVHDARLRPNNGTVWIPVDNLVGTLRLQRAHNVVMCAHFYAQERGTTAGTPDTTNAIATFRLFTDTTGHAATERELFGSSTSLRHWPGKDFSVHYKQTLAAGTHHIGVECNIESSNLAHGREVYVVARNMFIECRPNA